MNQKGEKLVFKGMHKWTKRYWEPKLGKCVCGEVVDLSHFTNTCSCGSDYNSSGSLLADRSQWGEETGESVSDILSVDSGSEDCYDE